MDLPPECLATIFTFLNVVDLFDMIRVCRTFQNIITNHDEVASSIIWRFATLDNVENGFSCPQPNKRHRMKAEQKVTISVLSVETCLESFGKYMETIVLRLYPRSFSENVFSHMCTKRNFSHLKSLVLYDLSSTSIEDLPKLAKCTPYLSELRLVGCAIDAYTLKNVCRAVGEHLQVLEIGFADERMDEASSSEPYPTTAVFSSLKELYLKNVTVNIYSMMNSPTIEVLKMVNCNNAFPQSDFSPNLRYLEFVGGKYENFDRIFKLNALETLIIDQDQFDCDQDLTKVLKSCHGIQFIDVRSDKVATAFVPHLFKCEALEYLSVTCKNKNLPLEPLPKSSTQPNTSLCYFYLYGHPSLEQDDVKQNILGYIGDQLVEWDIAEVPPE